MSTFPTNKWVYHVTHLDNLPGIGHAGGLLAKSQVQALQKIDYSNQDVQTRRARTVVNASVGGFLHNYVPFYFNARSPTFYAMSNGGSIADQFVIIVSSTHQLALFDWCFSDCHPVLTYAKFYTDLQDLCRLDWDGIERRYWNCQRAGNDKTDVRQAEFLVRDFVPIGAFNSLLVKTAGTLTQIQKIVGPNSGLRIYLDQNRFF